MATENNSRPVTRSTLPQIIFGALVGILLGIAGVLIYQGYLGQITNILLYVSLVFFGVVVLTFILVWGFKTYLTRLLFGSKVADSPDLIAEAQQMTDQLSSNVIDKLLEKATEEDKEKVKGLVVRLGNWFLWGRLRNWWWSWILGIFVSLGGLTGTLLLVNQNELLQNQNQLIKNQMSLEEASRRGALVMLMSNIFDKVDDEIAEQRVEMRRKGKVVTDSTKFSISQSLIGQIAALGQAFKPYRFMDGDTLIGRALSPERGQLLITISGLPLDTITLDKILGNCPLEEANLKGAFLSDSYLRGAYLINANFEDAGLNNANLQLAFMTGANLKNAQLKNANLESAFLENADLRNTYLEDADLSDANLQGSNLKGARLYNAKLSGANLINADLREVILLDMEQLASAKSLYQCKLPSASYEEILRKTHPKLFRKPPNYLED